MKTTSLFKTSLLLASGLALSATTSHAALYHVSINTAALVGNASGPFSLDFQLNSGDTLSNNTAVISSFTYGGGGAAFGAPSAFGGATGDLTLNSISLSDSSAFNEFYQSFTAGSTLDFDLNLSQNVDAGPTPDGFSFSILDSSLASIPTTGVGDTLLTMDINSAGLPAIADGSGTGAFSGISVTAVPEPSAALLGVLACGLGVLRRRRSN